MAGVTKLQISAILLGCAVCLAAADAIPVDTAPISAAPPTITDPDQLTEIVIEPPEPRYVAPTRRDHIGRIWAPVFINGKGPFRLVLDTGASRSGVTAGVASALGMTPDASAAVRLHSATGTKIVSTIHVDTLLFGDVLIHGSKLPILADALGGAEGILGYEGLSDRRVFIDFRNDLIVISRSHGLRAAPGFIAIPFSLERGRLMIARVELGHVIARAVIDTGAQYTVANLSLRDALMRHQSAVELRVDQIESVTKDIQAGEGRTAPPIELGPIVVQTGSLTFADLGIFEYWHLTREPALVIGMDTLGQLDTLIIDYRRRELQLRMRPGS
jgi:predicted aspartyl protease